MLGRRKSQTTGKRLLSLLWPSMSFQRVIQYYRHRMGRLADTPHAIGVGFATGLAISFTPFIGLHLLLAGLLTWIFRGSLIAMVFGSVAGGNPWTFPIIWIFTYKLGKTLLGENVDINQIPQQFVFTDILDLLWPMTLGSLPFIIVCWGVSFYGARHVAQEYKNQHNTRTKVRKKKKGAKA